MEYFSDLKNYFKGSYGYKEMTTKLPCAVIKDLIETMDDDSSTDDTVTAHFTHSNLLIMMLTTFGAFQDALPLQANNFHRQQNRKFRLSGICPYASSFAAVKYECSNAKEPQILMLLNQKPVALAWCKNGSVCTSKELHNMFNKSPMKNCPRKICGHKFVAANKRQDD